MRFSVTKASDTPGFLSKRESKLSPAETQDQTGSEVCGLS